MAIKRITISVPEEVAKRIEKAAGKAPVSAWLTELVDEHLNDAELERQWADFVRDVAPTAADVRRAEAMLGRLVKPPRKRGAA